MHLPSLVQIGGFGGGSTVVGKGYLMDALVGMSLRFGNLLKPTSGLSLNNYPQSTQNIPIFVDDIFNIEINRVKIGNHNWSTKIFFLELFPGVGPG